MEGYQIKNEIPIRVLAVKTKLLLLLSMALYILWSMKIIIVSAIKGGESLDQKGKTCNSQQYNQVIKTLYFSKFLILFKRS
jgi:hypothetical protein